MTGDHIPGDEPPDLHGLPTRLRTAGVSMIEMSFVDNAGIVRVKTFPLSRLESVARYGVGASPCFETFCFDDFMVYGRFLGGPDGDLRLIPDLDRVVPLAGQPGWAWTPADKFTQDGQRFAACQRAFARTQLNVVEDLGLRVSAAFEHEWTLSRGDSEDFRPTGTGAAYGQTRLEAIADHARELVGALHAQDIAVQQFHPEYSSGQVEVSVAATDPVGAADEALLVRHTARRMALSHGLHASFAPCVVPGTPGCGAHLHLSLHDERGNLFVGGAGPHGMRPAGEAFLAGVLVELPALQAIGAGNPASFLRMAPSVWAGVWQAWGKETREAAIRLILGLPGTADWAANAEVKCFDATANPYLVVGAVLAAGVAGIRDELRLPPEMSGDPALLGDRATVPRLPRHASEAADALADSPVLAKAMGEVLHDAMVTVRRAEAERFADATVDELVALTRWRW